MTTTTTSMNINEASKACGLSPSVLRIWELRYGWPCPKRKPNGYRAYNQHQVQELKRVAELVKGGTPISSLIIDGLPRWPSEPAHKRLPQGLIHARALPKPAGASEGKLQGELVEALEKRHVSLVKELLQRAFWSVRPDEEVLTVMVPTLVGLEELSLAERPLAEDGEIRQLVQERCLQLLRRFRKTDEPTLWVVPASSNDRALATLAALILNQRGHHAQVWLESGVPSDASLLLAGDHQDTSVLHGDRRVIGRVSSLGDAESGNLVSLLSGPTQPVPMVPLSAN